MSEDIVEELRDRAETEAIADNANPSGHIDWIASDEIIRLRAENEKLRREAIFNIDRIQQEQDTVLDTIADYNEAVAEIEKLRAELDEQARLNGMGGEREAKLASDNALLRAENEKLRAALKPFADAADDIEHGDKDSYNLWEHPAAMSITIGDLRNCQRILDGSTIE